MDIRLAAVFFAGAVFLGRPAAAQQPQSATSKPQMTKPAVSNADAQFLKDHLSQAQAIKIAAPAPVQ